MTHTWTHRQTNRPMQFFKSTQFYCHYHLSANVAASKIVTFMSFLEWYIEHKLCHLVLHRYSNPSIPKLTTKVMRLNDCALKKTDYGCRNMWGDLLLIKNDYTEAKRS